MVGTQNRILLVDDDSTNISILKNILEEDYELKAVDSGERALDVVYDFKPDIILLDVMMPGMDGYEVCQRLCKDDKLRFTKKILISAKAMLDERLKGYEKGADDYITKPFDDKELLAKVKVFLNLKFVEEVDELKSKFLYMFSHEIQAPLNGILSHASLLEKSKGLQEDERVYLKKIVESGNQLLNLSQKALLLSEVKSGMGLILKPDSIENAVNRVIKKLYAKSVEEQVVLIFDSEVIENFYFDVMLMEHAITFVLENVIRNSSPCSEIFISSRVSGNNCIIEVCDRGKGIEEGRQLNIFDEFFCDHMDDYQGQNRFSLSLAKNILQLHGGSLKVFNNSDKGVSFIFTLLMKNSEEISKYN